jgi:hypothetical protein
MKRSIAISFSLVYLLLTAGFTMNIHYCLGKIESVSIIPVADNCCCDDTGMDMGCCGNETMIFQFSPEDQLVQSDNSVFKAPLLEIIEIASIRSIDHEDHAKVTLKICNSPPPEDIPIWLKNSNFTFYG